MLHDPGAEHRLMLCRVTHSVSKTKRKEVLIGVRGSVRHIGLSELFLFMCRSAPVLSRSAGMHIFMGVLAPHDRA